MIVAIGTFLAGICTAAATEQERTLVDRLLKPNTSLANSAQGKKFSGTRAASFHKRIRSRSFYSPDKTVTQSFPDEHVFTSRQFAARHFRAGDSVANVSSRSRLTWNDTMIATPAASGIRIAPESAESTPVREFAGSRSFLDRGKSQKALQAQNKPLTIEQVRELLNKSK
jgi:hypothetical protein